MRIYKAELSRYVLFGVDKMCVVYERTFDLEKGGTRLAG